MILVVGLGNPGSQYECTRHNAGFLVIDQLAERCGLSLNQQKFRGFWAKGQCAGSAIGVLQPQTYMNCSGESVAACLKFFKLTPDQLIVVHDDLDLEPGQLKLLRDRGAGGHNGLKSIDTHLQTRDYWRLRVGIGRPPGRMQAADYVLKQVASHEWAAFSDNMIAATDAVELFIQQGAEAVQQRYHQRSA